MFRIPDDGVITVSFDIRAITPEGSEHLFTHVITATDVDAESLSDTLATLSLDAAHAFDEVTGGAEPNG